MQKNFFYKKKVLKILIYTFRIIFLPNLLPDYGKQTPQVIYFTVFTVPLVMYSTARLGWNRRFWIQTLWKLRFWKVDSMYQSCTSGSWDVIFQCHKITTLSFCVIITVTSFLLGCIGTSYKEIMNNLFWIWQTIYFLLLPGG